MVLTPQDSLNSGGDGMNSDKVDDDDGGHDEEPVRRATYTRR